jgi:hypothetical protein
MTTIKALFGSLVVAAVAAGFCTAPASAANAPIVITYAKTCVNATGHCSGTAGDGGTLQMQITSFRATGGDAQLSLTERITVGDISFTAELNGHFSPAGFIVLDGTVTADSFVGARIHQRSELVGSDETGTTWTGKLQLMPATA